MAGWTPVDSCSAAPWPSNLASACWQSARAESSAAVFSETCQLKDGTATLKVPDDGIAIAGRSVVIIDDVLATCGTVATTATLLRRAGATVPWAAVVLGLSALGPREVLKLLPVNSLYTV